MKRNTCDKCAHYTAVDLVKYPWQKLSHGKCALMGDSNDEPNDLDKCAGWDSESYSAGVYVGPKFGCIHWEKKPCLTKT